jgi:hypothetical protein
MLSAPTRRLLRRLLTVLPVAVSYGCSDAPLPVEPRISVRPHLIVGPTVTVTNTDDAGAGSLRQAILDAPDGATIQFDAGIGGATIVLSTGALTVSKALTIEGPVPAGMTISGGFSSQIFFVGGNADFVVRNLSIVHGRGQNGGAIENNGKVMLDHSLVADNEAIIGGGILLQPGAELTLVNTTVSGNVAAVAGGLFGNGAAVSIRNSTIAFNTSGSDGAGVLISDAPFNMRNSIIANNLSTSSAVADPNCAFGPTVIHFFAGRNISDDRSCGTDPSMIIADPRLDPLADNGGPTKTHAIGFGPAVDAGTGCSETTDQRYVLRDQGLSCDVGAFEFNTYGTVTITINPNAAVNTKTGVATVTGTMRCSAITAVVLDVGMSQTQKTTGRFTTIVRGQGSASVPACDTSPSSWSVALTPATGKFEPGVATGTASTAPVPGGFLMANVTAPLKMFNVK